MTILYQLFSTAILSYLCTTMGILYTLPASTLQLFSSENTTLDRVMTETEISFMCSISSASTFIAMPFCGYMLDKFGRKRTLILFYFPQLFGWLLLVTILKVEAFIFAMLLCGLSGSLFLIVPVYVNEFCDPSIRGALSSSAMIFHGLGTCISYLFGGFLKYKTMNYAGLTLAAFGIIIIFFLRESPLYLMKKGLEKEATLSIAFYKGVKPNNKEIVKEIDNIRRLLNSDIGQNISAEEEKFTVEENKSTEKFKIWNYLAKSRSTRRALFCILVIDTLCTFQGKVVILIISERLFQAAISTMAGNLSSVLFAAISVGTGLIGGYLIDKFGRRILLIVASIATGLLCVTLGSNIQFCWGPNWLTAVFIYLYAVTFTVGPGTVPSVLMSEMFLPEIKSFATTVCVEWAFTCNFIILYMFNPLFNAYGIEPLIYLFACFGLFTTIFCFIFLPETKYLPVDVIQQKLLQRFKPVA